LPRLGTSLKKLAGDLDGADYFLVGRQEPRWDVARRAFADLAKLSVPQFAPQRSEHVEVVEANRRRLYGEKESTLLTFQ
jgi:hypothetical protein